MFASILPGKLIFRLGFIAAMLMTLLAASAVANAQPAQASASGCTGYKNVTLPVVNMTIPSGTYCFGVNGSGLWVNNTSGSLSGLIYNRSEVIRLYDDWGQNYKTYYGSTAYGYSYGTKFWRQNNVRGTIKSGQICGTLTAGGAAVATHCHYVKP